MNVFVLMGQMLYGYEEVLGVYATKELAERCGDVAKNMRNDCSGYEVLEMELEKE